MVDPLSMLCDDRGVVAAGEHQMAGIQQQPHGLTGGVHHRVELGLCLDRRPHMMVEGQRHTLAGAVFGQRRQSAAIGGDVVIIQLRTAGKRPFLPVLDRFVCLAINDDRGTDSFEQRQLLSNALQL